MSAYEDIKKWTFDFLSKPLPEFNNLPPCPFAKKAFLDNKIVVVELDKTNTDKSTKDKFIEVLQNLAQHWPDAEAVVITCSPQAISSDELTGIVDNTKQFLKQNNLAAFEDHPDYLEKIGDCVLNNGDYAFIIVQEITKLVQIRKTLENTGYYNNWSQDYLDEVVNR